MGYAERIAAEINLPDEASERVQRLLRELVTAFDQGGRDAVTTALAERVRGLRESFDSGLRALEKRL